MKEKYFDLIGIYIAFLCMVHCLLMPVLLLLPLGLSHNPFIDCAFLFLGIFPVIKAIRGKAPVYIKIIIGLSFTLLALAIALEAIFEIENFLIYIGATGLITGHILNYKSHKH